MSVWTRRNREEEKGSDQREKSEKYSKGEERRRGGDWKGEGVKKERKRLEAKRSYH